MLSKGLSEILRMLLCLVFFFALNSDSHAYGMGRQALQREKESDSRSFPQLPRTHLPVPIIRQATHYSCGAASLLSVLYYWRAYDGEESNLYHALETTPEQGTEPPKIVEVAKSYGLEAEMKENLTLTDLRKALEQGKTAILSIQAWRSEENASKPWNEIWDDGHYVVLVAMDKTHVFVMDPSTASAYAYVSLDEFLERWHDFEDRHGTVWRYQHLAIFIHGKKPIQSYPSDLIRME